MNHTMFNCTHCDEATLLARRDVDVGDPRGCTGGPKGICIGDVRVPRFPRDGLENEMVCRLRDEDVTFVTALDIGR